jgi:hypothetical protein
MFWRNAGTIWLDWTITICVVAGVGIIALISVCVWICVQHHKPLNKVVVTTVEMQQNPGTADPSNGGQRGGPVIMPAPQPGNPTRLWYAKGTFPAIDKESQRQMLALQEGKDLERTRVDVESRASQFGDKHTHIERAPF